MESRADHGNICLNTHHCRGDHGSMAIGVVFSDKCLQGSCGGVSDDCACENAVDAAEATQAKVERLAARLL